MGCLSRLKEKKGGGGGGGIEVLVANPIIKSRFDKNMISLYVTCGHFAFSTLSETCFKEPVFAINVRKYNTKPSKIQKCKC